MSEAFKCDRCDAYEDGKPIAEVSFQLRNEDAVTKRFTSELCAPCLADLKDWRDEHKRAGDTV